MVVLTRVSTLLPRQIPPDFSWFKVSSFESGCLSFFTHFLLISAESEHAEIMQKDYPPRPLMISRSGVKTASTEFFPLYILLAVVVLGLQ